MPLACQGRALVGKSCQGAREAFWEAAELCVVNQSSPFPNKPELSVAHVGLWDYRVTARAALIMASGPKSSPPLLF